MDKKTKEVMEMALDALIWCSGAPVFGEGGDAHWGWKKLGRSAIEALREELYGAADTTPSDTGAEEE